MRRGLSLLAAAAVLSGWGPAQESGEPSEKVISSTRNGRFLVNGKPVFLLGYFSSGLFGDKERRAMVDAMAADGFNALHAVDWNSTPDEYRSFLDYAREKKVHVIHSVQRQRTQVRRYKAHPAIVAWYVDDAQFISLKKARVLHAGIVAEDATRVVLYSMGSSSLPHFEIAALGQRQYYPIQPGLEWDKEIPNAFGKFRRIVDHCRAKGGRVPQLAVQANQNRGGAFPTAVQNDLVCYLGIAAGMQGLMWWEFEDGDRPGVQLIKEEYPEFYESTRRVAREVSAMSSVYTEYADSIERTRHSPTLYSATWRGGGRSYVIVVNLGREAADVRVRMPDGTEGSPEKVFSDRPGGLTYDSSTREVMGMLPGESVWVYTIHRP